ncbi:hypothetical protein KSE_23420 [Kitasatospora setae KM-6054]|uniref:Uncharacterized protein n=1 Tax=Kitasatospora setae (strain ATCC 33774 / DSM 43861 / JCM 3304 / KCC A-0304 / NBRC 14216 / KM-6054) TaxID=452652 RepID=E4NAD0_KITSK|nr:hypothetical protein KSE_23420 [Kitasatospora setae KM-6054]
MNPGRRSLDIDGVDIQLCFPGRSGTMGYPLIEALIKSCCNPTYGGDSFSYSIPARCLLGRSDAQGSGRPGEAVP